MSKKRKKLQPFLRGVGSILDMSGSCKHINHIKKNYRTQYEDWKNIGKDFRKVINGR